MKKILGLIVISVLFISGCTPKGLNYMGDEAEMLLIDGRKIVIEIIAVTDSALIFSQLKQNAEYYYIPSSEIISVSVEGYAGDNWVAPVLLGQCVPVLLIGIAAASVESGNAAVAVVFAFPAALSFLIFGTTEGDVPEWKNPAYQEVQSQDDSLEIKSDPGMEYLRKYARYPDGLNEARLTWLLNSKGQSKLIRFQ